jgi:hypothetical protein
LLSDFFIERDGRGINQPGRLLALLLEVGQAGLELFYLDG